MILLPEILAENGLGNRAELTLRVPGNLEHFSGHFPGHPILPGVVTVDWAIRLARDRFAIDDRYFSGLSGVKFHMPVFPEARLRLVLQWNPERRRLNFESYLSDRLTAEGQARFDADWEGW